MNTDVIVLHRFNMLTRKDFRIDKCDNCIRITRTDIPGNKHTHLHSRKLAETVISNVCSENIPLHSHSRTLISIVKLSNNKNYISKINELLNIRKQKGQNQTYVNPSIKKSF